MGKRCKDPGVKCPYYCSEDPSKIYCEGIEEGNWIHMVWGDEKDKKEFKKEVCKKGWKDCPLAMMREKRI